MLVQIYQLTDQEIGVRFEGEDKVAPMSKSWLKDANFKRILPLARNDYTYEDVEDFSKMRLLLEEDLK